MFGFICCRPNKPPFFCCIDFRILDWFFIFSVLYAPEFGESSFHRTRTQVCKPHARREANVWADCNFFLCIQVSKRNLEGVLRFSGFVLLFFQVAKEMKHVVLQDMSGKVFDYFFGLSDSAKK